MRQSGESREWRGFKGLSKEVERLLIRRFSNREVFFLCCGIRAHEARKGFNGGTCNKSPNRST